MHRILIQTLAAWSLCPPAAHAQRIQLTCSTVMDRTGDQERRTVLIDTDHRIVRDAAMTFTDGATSPLASDIEEFVTVENHRAMWGNRRKLDKAGAGVFTVDLLTGQYAFTSRVRGRLSHGVCRQLDESI